jgi:hypothetical protein
MMIRTLICCISLLIFASPASAGSSDSYAPLTATEMDALLPGSTIKGEYRTLRQRSQTFNFSETHHDDGTTQYKEGDFLENGLWYTLGDRKICYKYPENPEMLTSCFWVYKSVDDKDGCYYGYGLANMSLRGPRNFNDWTARWIIEGSGSSCDAPVG